MEPHGETSPLEKIDPGERSQALRDERRRLTDRFLNSFIAEREEAEILWTLGPLLRALYGVQQLGEERGARDPSRAVALTEQLASKAISVARPSGQRTRYVLAGDVTALIGGENERRSIEPILDLGADGALQELSGKADPARLRALTRSSLRLAREFVAQADHERVGLPCGPRRLLREFIGTARHMAYTEAILDRADVRAVIVGTNHSKQGRGLARAARARGIPSVYVPHAPMLADLRFRDLPFDFAALRGAGELDWYREHGLGDGRVVAVGNPGLPPIRLVDIPADAPIVFAVADYSPEVIQTLVSVIAGGTQRRVVVSPYPGQKIGPLRKACPPDWDIWRGRTYDLLAEGAAAVIQYSSGVALESLLMGLPTIELSLGHTTAGYPLIDPDYVHFASGPVELRRSLAMAQREALDARARQRLQDWARRWCAQAGRPAAEAAWSVLSQAAHAPAPPGPIWDAWSPSALGQQG